LSDDLVTYHNSDIIFKNLKIKGFGLDNWLLGQSTSDLYEMTSFLDNLITDGRLKLPVHKSFSLDKYQEALTADQDSHKQGKVIFKN